MLQFTYTEESVTYARNCIPFLCNKNNCVLGSKSTSLYDVPDTIMKDGSTYDLVICYNGSPSSAIVGCMFPKICVKIKFLKTKTKLINSNKTIYDTCVLNIFI
jgi:hypothetical protein